MQHSETGLLRLCRFHRAVSRTPLVLLLQLAAVPWVGKDQFRARKTATLAHGLLPQKLINGIIVTHQNIFTGE